MCAIKEPGVSFYLKTEEILYFLYDITGLCGPKGRWHAIGTTRRASDHWAHKAYHSSNDLWKLGLTSLICGPVVCIYY